MSGDSGGYSNKWLFYLSRGMLFLLAILVAFQRLAIDVRELFTEINEQFTAIAKEYGILDPHRAADGTP